MNLLRFSQQTTPEIVNAILTVCFPDALTALDVTYGNGAFWNGAQHVRVTGLDLDPDRGHDGTCDFRDLAGLEGFCVVVFDPPHLADAGEKSIMGQRFGTYRNDEIKQVVQDGARECWRAARLGVIIKVADHVHGQRFVPMTDWVKDALRPHEPYEIVHQVRARSLHDPKWGSQLSAYNNGATYLIYRKDGPRHIRRNKVDSMRPAH